MPPIYVGFDVNSKTIDPPVPIEVEPEKAFHDPVRKDFDRRYYYPDPSGHFPLSKPALIDGEGSDIVVPDDYSTIQEAVDITEEGERILVRAGNYNETVQIDTIGLAIHCENKYTTCITGEGNSTVIGITKNVKTVNISSFTINNSEHSFSGIFLSSEGNISPDFCFMTRGKY